MQPRAYTVFCGILQRLFCCRTATTARTGEIASQQPPNPSHGSSIHSTTEDLVYYYGLDEDELERLINEGGGGGNGGIINQQQQRQQSMDEQGVTFSIFHSFTATSTPTVSSPSLYSVTVLFYVFMYRIYMVLE